MGWRGLVVFGPSDFLGQVAILGTVKVTGDLTVVGGSKQFVLDHPLDPANRYLRHAAVESAELKTFYDGVASLDAEGETVIELPPYFGLLNGDTRFQLTPIGYAAPNLHVAEGAAGNRFRIAGGHPGQRVCWQVTGVRRDPSALAHPLVVEEEKADGERGLFLEPELHGANAEQGLYYTRHSEWIRLGDQLERVHASLKDSTD